MDSICFLFKFGKGSLINIWFLKNGEYSGLLGVWFLFVKFKGYEMGWLWRRELYWNWFVFLEFVVEKDVWMSKCGVVLGFF